MSPKRGGLPGLLLLFFLISNFVCAQDGSVLRIGDTVPPLRFGVFGQTGSIFDLSAQRGKVVILEFWATWCGSCVAAIPHWNELVDKFAGKPVVFVSVTDDDEEQLARFLKSKPIKGILIRDQTGKSFQQFTVVGRPQTIVIGPDGKVIAITFPEQVTEQSLGAVLANGTAQFAAKELKGDNLNWDLEEIDWKDGLKPDLQVLIKPIRIGVSAARYVPGSNRLTADGVPLFVLVMLAYSTDPFHLDWRASHGDSQYRASVVVPHGREAMLLPLLQAAISAQADIRARWEDREKDVYILRRIAGAKPMEPSVASEGTFYSMRGKSHAVKQPISRLVEDTSNHLEKIVVDETGLIEKYDWDLPYQPGQPEVTIGSVKKLGLELVPGRRTVRMLVVE